jgi:hypothetical protein
MLTNAIQNNQALFFNNLALLRNNLPLSCNNLPLSQRLELRSQITAWLSGTGLFWCLFNEKLRKSFVVPIILRIFALEHRRHASVEVPVRHCG